MFEITADDINRYNSPKDPFDITEDDIKKFSAIPEYPKPERSDAVVSPQALNQQPQQTFLGQPVQPIQVGEAPTAEAKPYDPFDDYVDPLAVVQPEEVELATDKDQSSVGELFAHQVKYGFLRAGASVLSDIGRRATSLFDADEGAFFKDEQGNIIGAQIAPADYDLRKQWKENIIAQMGDRADFTSAEDARTMEGILANPSDDPRIQAARMELTAQSHYNRWLKNSLFGAMADFVPNVAEELNDLTDGAIVGNTAAFQDKWEDVARIIGEDASDEIGQVDPLSKRAIVGMAGQSIGQMVPSLALAATGGITKGLGLATTEVAPLATLGSFAAIANAVTGQDYADQGKDISRTREMQELMAYAEAIPEVWAVAPLMEVGQPIVKGFLQLLYRELPSEMASTILGDIAHEMVMEPERPFGDFMKDLVTHLTQTAAMVPLSVGVQRAGMESIYRAAQGTRKVAFGAARAANAGKEVLIRIGDSIAPQRAVINKAKEKVMDRAQYEAAVQAKVQELHAILQQTDDDMAGYEAPQDLMQNADVMQKIPLQDPIVLANLYEDYSPDHLETQKRVGQALLKDQIVTRKDGTSGTITSLGVQPGEVVIVGQTPLEILKQQEANGELTAIPKKAIEARYRKAEEATNYQNEIWDFVQSLVTRHMPGSHFLLNFSKFSVPSLRHFNNDPKAGGIYFGVKDAETHGMPPIASITLMDRHSTSKENLYDTKYFLASIVHEVGHAFEIYARGLLANRYPNIGNLLNKAHADRLKQAAQESSFGRALAKLASPRRLTLFDTDELARTLKKAISDLKKQNRKLTHTGEYTTRAGYFFSQQEFLAEQLIAYHYGKKELAEETKQYIKDLDKEISHLHEDITSHPDFAVSESYREFVEAIFKVHELQEQQRKLALAHAEKLLAIEELKALTEKKMGPERFQKLVDSLVTVSGQAAELALVGENPQGNLNGKQATESGIPQAVASPSPKIRLKDFTKKTKADLTKYNFIVRMTAGLVQLIRMNPHIQAGQLYLQATEAFWRTKSWWTAKATDLLLEWREHTGNLWQDQVHSDNFDNALVEMDEVSDAKGKRLTTREVLGIAKKHNLGTKDVRLMNKIWGMYAEALTEMEQALIDRIIYLYSNDLALGPNKEKDMNEEIARVRSDFAKMRDRNYVPHTRFGKYRVEVKAKEQVAYKGILYKKGQTILYTGSDNLREHNALMKEINIEFANPEFGVKTDEILDDTILAFQGLQPEMAALIAKVIKMTDAQQEQLREIMVKSSPGQSIRKHLLRRKGIAGYSTDMQRVFADYFARFSSYVARVKHSGDLEDAITYGWTQYNQMSGKGIGRKLRSKRQQFLEHLQRHYDYLMNPGEEYANIRAAGFVWYLGFNAKSAVVNFTQVPFVTYPYLAQRFGDVNASAEMGRTMTQVTNHFLAKANRVGGKKQSPLNPGILQMWDELKNRQVLDEGMTTMLAGLANDRTLIGLKSKGAAAQSMRIGLQWAGWMFQTTEKLNRYFTATAAYNLAIKSGMGQLEATEFAYTTVQDTQFEYARWNRPEMMRGKTSPIFLFYQYLTSAMYFVHNDPSRWRYLMIMLMMGGYTALPGVENFLDIMDATITRFKGQLGMPNPKTQLRVEMAGMINELADNVSWMPEAMHTWVADNAAKFAEDGVMGNLNGYNLQNSMSLGNILMFDTSILSSERDIESKVGGVVQDAAGAPAEAALNILYAVFTEEPWTWKRLERAMPTFAKNISSSLRTYKDQLVLDNSGNTVMVFDNNDPYTFSSFLAEAAGFKRADVQRKREAMYWAKDAARYYQNQESYIFTDYFKLRQLDEGENPPTEKDWERFDARVERYNNSVSELDHRLTISQKRLQESWEQRKNAEYTQELYGHKQKKYGDIATQVLETRR